METPVNRLKLKDNKELLSPPVVAEPLYSCATAVKVVGFRPHALLSVQVNGTTVVTNAPGGFPFPNGAMLTLPNPLKAKQKVRARQKLGGLTSGWSAVVIVKDFTADYPAGPPRPEINPAPVYECGSRTGVGNLLLGCEVWITADGTEVGRVQGANDHQGVNVAPDYTKDDHVVAQAQMCDDKSPPSKTEIAQQQPAPLPAPVFEPWYEGGEQLVLNTLANGARFTVSRNGSGIGTWRTWGGRHFIGVSPPSSMMDTFEATQQLCPSVGPSPSGKGSPLPCSALPAPTVGPIQDGDQIVTLLSFVPDAHIRVYLDGEQVGDSGGPVVVLTTPVHGGQTVVVRQSVGTCDGKMAQVIKVRCADPPTAGDPAHFNLFPVGTTEYDGGTVTLGGETFSVKGTVYYPADSDGPGTPFNAQLAEVGKVPIVFMAHGNHDASAPSHLGYDYFQTQLAQMGIVACSVFLNETNGFISLSIDNIHDRADLIIAGIAHMKSLSDGGDPLFGGKLDFARVGTMGHSRGGDAVVAVLERITTPGVTIKAVIALAPTNIGASSGKPTGVAFMTILPAADGDVVDNNGAVFYDGATPAPLKVQLYVINACHNYFNREWPNNDNGGGLPTMPKADHERILSAYGCALYRAFLLGHDTTGYLTYRVLPAGVPAGSVQLAFAEEKPVEVDHYEDGNGIAQNSLHRPNTQAGGIGAAEFPCGQVAGAFNPSFFGNSTGMVCKPTKKGGTFRWELPKKTSLSSSEVWIRCAEVYTGSIPANATGFQLGLEDATGLVGWVDCDEVGGLPRPYDRQAYDLGQDYHTDLTKTMLRTLRFNPACCVPVEGTINLKQIMAILIKLNRPALVPLAFDDLHIIKV